MEALVETLQFAENFIFWGRGLKLYDRKGDATHEPIINSPVYYIELWPCSMPN